MCCAGVLDDVIQDFFECEQNIPVHSFNLEDPMAGDAVTENAMGYLMRNAQWLVQTIGVDGLRIDAGKHMQGFTFDYFDRGVYRSQDSGESWDSSPGNGCPGEPKVLCDDYSRGRALSAKFCWPAAQFRGYR